jgi:predicted esterase
VPRKTYRWTTFVLLASLLAGCGSSHKASAPKPTDPLAPYAYDQSKPLRMQLKGAARRAAIEVRDISFIGPRGERILAYLVVPPGRGRHSAIIYGHGAGGDRSELLPQAFRMGQRGAVSLTLDLPFSATRAVRLKTGIDGVRTQVDSDILAVREVRRGVDLLRSLPYVDGERIAYVGWSAGARIGAITSGVDHRIASFDLLAGGAVPVSVYAALAPPNLRDEVIRLVTKADAYYFVRRAAPSALFFQDGRHDRVVSQTALRQLAHDGSRPKEFRWYESGHVPSDRAWADSRDWLSGRLGLPRKAH